MIVHNQSHAISRSFTLGTNFFHWTHFAMIRILLFLGNRKVINFFYSLVELQKSAKDPYATNILIKSTIWVKYMKPNSSWMRNHWESIIKGKINAQHFSNIRLKSGTYYLISFTAACLFIFYSVFHCGVYCRAVGVTDNLSTKQA